MRLFDFHALMGSAVHPTLNLLLLFREVLKNSADHLNGLSLLLNAEWSTRLLSRRI